MELYYSESKVLNTLKYHSEMDMLHKRKALWVINNKGKLLTK